MDGRAEPYVFKKNVLTKFVYALKNFLIQEANVTFLNTHYFIYEYYSESAMLRPINLNSSNEKKRKKKPKYNFC